MEKHSTSLKVKGKVFVGRYKHNIRQQQIRRKKASTFRKFISIVISIGVSVLLTIVLWQYLDANYQPRYFPTMEAAFRYRYRDTRGGGRLAGGRTPGIGEIIFIHDHEDNVTVYHRWGTAAFLSHFIRVVDGEQEFFRCVGISTGGTRLSSDPELIAQNEWIISHFLFGPDGRFGDRIPSSATILQERIGRVPLHGISTDPNIFNLTINGQTPDYIVVSNVRPPIRALGEEGDEVTVYFWYFSDFQFTEGDEIVISFGQ